MKALTSIELGFVVKELEILIDKRLEKIYQRKNEFLFQFQGRALLRIILPSLLFLTDQKPQMPERPSDFAMVLRKHLSNSRIRKIQQIGSERILVFEFDKCKLIVELFSKGNIILCRHEKIVSALLYHKWRDRTIRGGISYQHPPPKMNLFSIKEGEFQKSIQASNRDSIVKTLAVDLGLGGIFAEELCRRARLEKSKRNYSDRLYGEFKKMLDAKAEPVVAIEDSRFIEALPFPLHHFKNYKKVGSFSEALSLLFLQEAPKEKSAEEEESERLKRVLEDQKSTIMEIKNKAKENEDKAKYIYEHYSEIQPILKLLKDLKKQKKLKTVKSRLIKEINEKEGKVTVEI